jgi:hypothetical protein
MITVTNKENCLTITSNDVTVTIPYDLFALDGQRLLGKIANFQKLLRGTPTPQEREMLEQEQCWMPLSGVKTGYQLYLDSFSPGNAYLEWNPTMNQVCLGQIPTVDRRTQTRPYIVLPKSLNIQLADWLDRVKAELPG